MTVLLLCIAAAGNIIIFWSLPSDENRGKWWPFIKRVYDVPQIMRVLIVFDFCAIANRVSLKTTFITFPISSFGPWTRFRTMKKA